MTEETLKEIDAWFARGLTGRQLSSMLTRKVDEVLKKIVSSAGGRMHAALLATGGYGRSELSPFSDVDVMFYARDRADTETAERILYGLWDTGMEISHSYRTSSECIEEAFADIRTRTSLIESRFIAGDKGLYEAFRREVYPEINYKKQKEFVREKLIEMGKRHLDAGNSVYLLEPHIKEGEGGLRDIHTAYWLSRVALRKENFDEFLALLSRNELKQFISAYDFLLKARFGLHLESRRKHDILSFDYQEGVAARLGFRDSKKFKGTERLLRYYYLKGSAIKNITKTVTAICSRTYVPVLRDMSIKKVTDDFAVSGGRIIIRNAGLFARNPDKLVEAFAIMSRTGRKFSQGMREAVRANLLRINKKTRSSTVAVQHFMEILRGDRVHETLHEMHESGVLGRFIPEFGALRKLVVHEPYHMYTVDEHTLVAVRNLETLRTTRYKSLEDLHDVMRSVGRLDTLYMSILFHDIGKAAGRQHGEEGYKRLKNIMERFHVDTTRRMRIEFLVRNHILMSRTALRRETSDSEVIAMFADAVGDQENLKAIYLITYADMSAVNPGFWSSWKAYLLRELYEQTMNHLSGIRRDRAGLIRELQTSLPLPEAKQLSDFIREMPERYLLSSPNNGIIEDYRLVQKVRETGFAARTVVTGEMAEFSVYAEDCPGLFSNIVGFISSKGLNIVSGRIFTGKAGIVIDKISVSNWRDIWWEGLEADIEEGLRALLMEGKPLSVARRGEHAVLPFGVFIELDNEASEEYSIIEILSPDRMGLLHDVSRCMHEKGVNIDSAKILTESGLAQDVFYVQKKKAKINYADTEDLLAGLWTVLTG